VAIASVPSDNQIAAATACGAALSAAAATINILSGSGEIGWASAEVGTAVLAALTSTRYAILAAAGEITDKLRAPVRGESCAREDKPASLRVR
jgi:hypothetical protein